MPDYTDALIADLRAWARDAHVRAAVELLIEQDHWLWDDDFVSACVARYGDTTCLSWTDAAGYLESGPPCSDGEASILRIAIDIGSGRWQLGRLDIRNRARVVAAVTRATGISQR